MASKRRQPITPAPVSAEDLDLLGAGAHWNPHGILGVHPHGGALTIRSMRPLAKTVVVELPDGSTHPMEHEANGIWVVAIPSEEQGTDYRLQVTYENTPTVTVDDPYRFMPTIGELDLHLVGEGRHEQLWTVLGAHERRFSGPMGEVHGTSFTVWAPNARAVRLMCDHNHWDGTASQLRSLGHTGVWEIFLPDVLAGTKYRFHILGRDGHWHSKSDPLAQSAELRPANASVVTRSDYTWGDKEWISGRAAGDLHHGPMSIYEVHLGSWRPGLSYRTAAEPLRDYVLERGFTHVEFMPLAEHPFDGSWGYQVTGYFAATSRFGHPDDLRYLIDTLHQAGIGVIMDWVPAHFPKDDWALARFDGSTLYEYADPRKGEHPDWGTLVFDYGRNEVRNFLVANALYWLEEFHVDALRVDAVASMLYLDYSRNDGAWVPNRYGGREHLEAISFLQEVTATAYKRNPGVTIMAEESTAWPGVTRPTHLGGLGFGFKWNMGWMNDSLAYIKEDPVHRQYHHHRMTFSLVYAFSENYVLPISHDEVVHGKGSMLHKMPGDRWKQLANLRAFYAFMWAHPGKQLIFMGCEFAQAAEWSEANGLDWWLLDHAPHIQVQQLITDLNRAYKELPALWEQDEEPAGFEWIDASDTQHNTLSFIRYSRRGEPLVCVVNFSGIPHHDYRLGLPRGGVWQEVINTDADIYGGSGVGNSGAVTAEQVEWHGRPNSAVLSVPPLGALWLRPTGLVDLDAG